MEVIAQQVEHQFVALRGVGSNPTNLPKRIIRIKFIGGFKMRLKIVLALVAFMGLICICCKNENINTCDTPVVTEISDSTAVADTVIVDSLMIIK